MPPHAAAIMSAGLFADAAPPSPPQQRAVATTRQQYYTLILPLAQNAHPV
jgi:hypothetical protein